MTAAATLFRRTKTSVFEDLVVWGFVLLVMGWAVALAAPKPAGAATILSDSNSQVTFDLRDGVLQITSWKVNGTEEVGRKWYYWRTSGASEVALSSFTQTSLTPSNNNANPGDDKLVAVWTASNFRATVTFTLTGGQAGGLGATLGESFYFQKIGGGPLDCHLFAYDDFNLGGAGFGNTLAMPTTSSAAVAAAGGQSIAVTYDAASSFRQTGLAGDSPGILGGLTDAAISTLTNSTLAVSGDTVGAFQWDFRITPMASKTINGSNVMVTPEPATMALLACGGVALLLRRKRAAARPGAASVSGLLLMALVATLALAAPLFAQMGGGGGGGMGGGGMGGNRRSMLGRMIFNDTNLSEPMGVGCTSCHSATAGFADSRKNLPVSVGSVPTHVGARNSPTAAYASYSPTFHYDAVAGQYVGGQFWDGRAATLADQAKGPFLNPLEHAMPNKAAVVTAVKNSMYGNMFRMEFGSSNTVDQDYNNIAAAIAAYEASTMVNQFTSKYDRYRAGTESLTTQETHGMQRFQGSCTGCHSMSAAADGKQVFTNFTYRNAGVPRNPANPFYDLPADLNPDGEDFIDLGLGGALGLESENGKFKVPTLRNVGVTGPYTHNGYFLSLEEMIDYMANRDLYPDRWASPEVEANLSLELGNFNFTSADVADVAAFLRTLTDAGMVPEPATLALLAMGVLVSLRRRRR